MKRFLLLFVLVVVAAGALVSNAGALGFDDSFCPKGAGTADDPRICPQGVVGTPYSLQVVGRAGCWPYSEIRLTNGALPPGLAMSSSGLISGTPTQAGAYTFWIQLQDVPGNPSWCTDSKTSERAFLINVIPALTLDTASVPPATLNVPYSTTLSASPPGTHTWTVADGSLPPGLSLGATDGVISGTPTTVGSFHFAIRVSDTESRSYRREFIIDVAEPLVIGGTLGQAEVGAAFQGSLTATGGTGPTFTWSVGGGALPPGLALGADGSITGTPTTAGTYGFAAAVADTVGRTTTLPLKITVKSRLAITTLVLRPTRVGRLYQAKLKTTGGVLPKSWKVILGPLPRGIRLDRTLGILSGTPRKAGRYRFNVQVTDALGVKSTKRLTLIVGA